MPAIRQTPDEDSCFCYDRHNSIFEITCTNYILKSTIVCKVAAKSWVPDLGWIASWMDGQNNSWPTSLAVQQGLINIPLSFRDTGV